MWKDLLHVLLGCLTESAHTQRRLKSAQHLVVLESGAVFNRLGNPKEQFPPRMHDAIEALGSRTDDVVMHPIKLIDFGNMVCDTRSLSASHKRGSQVKNPKILYS